MGRSCDCVAFYWPITTTPITACVDAYPHQPWGPHHEFSLIHVLKLLIYLQENLLGDLFGDAPDGGSSGVGLMKNTRKRNFQTLAALLKNWFSAEKQRDAFGAPSRSCLHASGRFSFFTMWTGGPLTK